MAPIPGRPAASPRPGCRSRGVPGRELVAPTVVAILGALAYLAFPDDLAFFTRIIVAALFVMSLDLVVGYCGVATLGHAVLYGAGAYAAGILCVNGLTDPLLLIAGGSVAGVVAGLVTALVILRAHGLPQLVLSIAVVQLAYEAANKARDITGGSDGLSGISPGPVFGLFEFDLWGRTAYVLALVLLIATLVVLRRVVRSPFGLLCRGIKQDPDRIRAIGGTIYGNLVKMYALSGAVAGLAGGLTAVTTGVVGLDSVSFEWSAEALVMLVLGGAGTLYGALVGAVVFTGFEHYVAAVDPYHWLFVVGALLIGVVLALPAGLGSLAAWLRRLLPQCAP